MPSTATLLGRDEELARIRGLLAAARDGASGTLVLLGPPGIGKTSLLDAAIAEAEAHGMQVLRARGYAREADYAYGALLHLLRPVIGLRDTLPEVQRRALGIALAIEPPEPLDPFAVPAAVLNLLAAAAEQAPVVLAVDDAQWIDEASLRALLFAARRLHREGVALLATARDEAEVLAAVEGLPVLGVGPLARDAALAVVAAHHDDVSPSVAARLVERTAGNPLALVEIPALLTPAERAGGLPLEGPLPLTEQLERGFAGRVAELGPPVRRALLLAAMLESSDARLLHRALAADGIADDALQAAERSRLLVLDDEQVDFRHPLVRSAIEHHAGAAERRSAHRVLATVVDDPARRAHHLALAQVAPSEEVAADLERLAHEALARGGHGAAARAFERAAQLSPHPGPAGQRELGAARAWLACGVPSRGMERLDAIDTSVDGAPAAAAVNRLRAQLEMRRGNPLAARDLLTAEADRLAASAPASAAEVMMEAAPAQMMTGNLPGLIETAQRTRELAERGDVPELVALADVVIGEAYLAQGRSEEGDALLAARHDFLMAADPRTSASEPLGMAGHSLMWIEQYARAEQVLDRLIDIARAHSAFGKLVYPLAVRSQLDFRRGRWVRALADADEAVQLADATGQVPIGTHALGVLTEVLAGLGRSEAAHEAARRSLELTANYGLVATRAYALRGLGIDHLAWGRVPEALRATAEAAEIGEQLGLRSAGITMFLPDHVEALAQARDLERAAEITERFRELAVTGGTWGPAALARCEGLIAGDEESDVAFERSLELHRQGLQPFEHARTALLYGERLRRRRRRVDAREQLAFARDRFAELGAVPWQQRAERELLAAGGERSARDERPADALTPAELQVALMVARGLRNRDVSAGLYVSEKTVERQLTAIYRKLGIRSRAQLAAAFAGDAGDG